MMTTLHDQIDFFFAPPLPMQPTGNTSTLHLARREAQDCLIGDVIAEDLVHADPRDRHRLFATMMVVMAAIDLLAKFYAGSDANRGVGERIKAFASAFIFVGDPAAAKEFADVLYIGCRNPLLHSFTLHQPKYSVALVDRFRHGGPIMRVQPTVSPDAYLISVEGIFGAFLNAVRAYETAVRSDAALQANFAKMFPPYGSINVELAI